MQSNIFWFIVALRVEFLNAVDNGRYRLVETMISYENAVTECESAGEEILTLHTPEEYAEFLEWLPYNNEGDRKKDIWVGLKQLKAGEEDYAWVDDDTSLEKQLCWYDNQPSDESYVQCAYMNSDGKLSTKRCTDMTKMACYDPVSETDTVTNKDVTFYDAAQECYKQGHYLPILKTKDQREELKDKALGVPVWVGLIEVEKNIYRWINADSLPRYKWDKDDRGRFVHGHRDHDDFFYLHAPKNDPDNSAIRNYVCQKINRNGTMDNYYKLEAGNAVMYLPPLDEYYIQRRTDCAMQCSRESTCLQYTLEGSVCKTYGKGLYWTSDSYGVNLFKRRIVTKYL